MKVKIVFLIISMIFGLSHCRVVKDESSPFFTYPKTLKLVLKQDIQIPPTDVAISLQFGKIATKVKRHHPFCELEVLRKNDVETQTLPAGEYPVIRVVRDTGMAATRLPKLAALESFQLASAAGEEFFITQFIMAKTPSGNIRSLACKHLAENNLGEHLTLPQIRQALGALIEVQF